MSKSDAIQWFPGHMAKAERQIREKLRLIDIVIEVLDARVPISGKNPDISSFTKNKQHLIVLNKADLADSTQISAWEQYFLNNNQCDRVISFNALESRNRKKLVNGISDLNIKNKKQVKCLVCGIPNVGKSTIINTLLGKKKTIIGNKPGITKGQQWLNTSENIMLLDTPGILWPKFDDESIGKRLAWIGSVKDTLYEKENIAADLISFLLQYYPEKLQECYQIDISDCTVPEIFDLIAEKRKLLLKGGEYNYFRLSEVVLNDFKNGRIGRITLDVME